MPLIIVLNKNWWCVNRQNLRNDSKLDVNMDTDYPIDIDNINVNEYPKYCSTDSPFDEDYNQSNYDNVNNINNNNYVKTSKYPDLDFDLHYQ